MLKKMPGITCADLDSFIVDYLDGRLSVRLRRIFERHLRQCSECEAYAEGYRQTVALAGLASRFPDEPVPGDVPKALVDAILAARARLDRSGR